MNRRRTALLVTLFLATLLSGAGRTIMAAEEPARNESVTASPLSKEEREWATEIVAPLLTPEEKKIYSSLPTPAERTAFRDEFWRLRERDGLRPPFGPGFKNMYQGRLQTANETFGGWKTDAGRIVLALGEPANVTEIDCPSIYRPIEVWVMSPSNDRAVPSRLVFYRDFQSGPLKLWSPILGPDSLLSPAVSLGAPDPFAKRGELSSVYAKRCGAGSTELGCEHECDVLWPAIIAMENQGDLGAALVLEKLATFPAPPEGDWTRWRSQFVGGTAAQGPGAVISAKPEAPASPAKKLSRADRKALETKLGERYREWLGEVDLIITEQERDVFLQIADNVERDKFIEEFWRRRSLDKDGVQTNFREIFRERVEYAKENFKNLNSDASKIFILNGPPDAIIPVDCPEVFVPVHIWYYERLEALKSKAYLILYRPYSMGDWKLWLPIDGVQKLSIDSLGSSLRQAEQNCFAAQTLEQAISYSNAILGAGISGMAEAEKMFARPPVETEGIDRFLGLTTQLSAGAAALAIQKNVIFPEAKESKIACDVSLFLPRKDLALRDLGDQRFYDIDVIGEVVQNDRMLDNFKYRFDIPIEEASGETLPLTLRRYLYPGDYEIRVKAADANRKAEGRFAEALHVPEQPQGPPAILAGSAASPKKTEAMPSDFRPSSISILPPVRDILTGLQRFETKTAEGIIAVDFYLDGTKMLTRTKGPFQADLNLGPLPRRHEVRVVAYDARGRSVGEDELHVNEGSESFRVKIVSPTRGTTASGPTTVIADATAPEGRAITKMEFYSNEMKVATLYQPPWQQIVPFRRSGSLGYVRVVGTLDDGLVAEDLRYVNAPAYISEVNVDAVELYTTVTQGNRPVDGLAQTNFKIFEDGKEQQLAQFEHVTNLPITVGVAIDTSASMIENLPEAETAAVEFLDRTIMEKDRGFTMSFDDSPYTLCRLTGNRERLDRSFAGLRAEGSTALYDAVVYALYQFSGVKGKKALVLLTDGKDTSSKYDFDTLLDYVKKAGVAVYGIGLNVSKAELEVKSKLNRLAEASGGTTFYIDNTRGLKNVYQQINNELRTQYLLTYYSSNPTPDNKWRKVDVKVTPKTLSARTISGYYS